MMTENQSKALLTEKFVKETFPIVNPLHCNLTCQASGMNTTEMIVSLTLKCSAEFALKLLSIHNIELLMVTQERVAASPHLLGFHIELLDPQVHHVNTSFLKYSTDVCLQLGNVPAHAGTKR